jgi:selenocysteine lyase/cysteine desulfurase
MTEWLDQAARDGDAVWLQWSHRVEELRRLTASLINASEAEIAFVPNTTAGLSLLAEGFPWQAGDNVVTLDNEFPSNLYPWMNLADLGVETRRVAPDYGRVDLNRIAAACDERTRVLSLSWVGYASGWRIDVAQAAQLAHEHGAVFCLDAIQGLGVYSLDVKATGVDFLSADGHKWLLGPEGAGVCYIQPALMEKLRPLGVGWNSVQHRSDFGKTEFSLRATAARYEGGSTNMVGYHGLAASLELLTSFGLAADCSRIGERVIAMTDLACDRMSSIGCGPRFELAPAHKSGILTFDTPGIEPEIVRKTCLDQHVVVSCRGGGLRVAPHAYTNEDDIERLICAVKSVLP